MVSKAGTCRLCGKCHIKKNCDKGLQNKHWDLTRSDKSINEAWFEFVNLCRQIKEDPGSFYAFVAGWNMSKKNERNNSV